MKLKNYQMDNMMLALQPLLEQKGMLGYVVSRNYRKLRDAVLEYTIRKQKLIQEYGKSELDEDGNPTGGYTIDVTDKAVQDALEELNQYADIEHDVEIMKIPVEDVIDELTGNDILALEFMLEDRGQLGGDTA